VKLFSTLCLEITSDCNRKCSFCPVAYGTRPKEEMALLDIERAADELAQLRYRGRVELYIYNEPLKNRSALYAALEALRSRCNATVMIATNGDFLKGAADIDDLFQRGLHQLILNAYTAKQYPRFVEWAAAFPDALKNDVYAALARGKTAIRVYDKSTPERFGTGVFRLQNRAGNVPATELAEACALPVARMCVKPFRLLNINWRGEALICCNDYHGDVIAGRFPEQSLEDIWNGPVLNAYRARLAQKDRSLPLCRTCDCHAGAYPHNVDKAAGPAASPEEIEAAYGARVAARQGEAVQLGRKR
jgi:MoaA/NifB/PqqE/SkfB family radical SAM enzyme